MRGERNVSFYSFDRIIRDWKKGGGKLHSTLYKHGREKNITIGFKFSIAIDEAILFSYFINIFLGNSAVFTVRKLFF